MRSHRSKSRYRKLRHAAGLYTRLLSFSYDNVPPVGLINETWSALIRLGWKMSEVPRSYIKIKGIVITTPCLLLHKTTSKPS